MANLIINGRNMSVDAADDTPLLWVIREQLQMTGTKFGCGAGLCGACTVHVNGEAVRSCQTAVKEAVGKQITTIEGLSEKESRWLLDHLFATAADPEIQCRFHWEPGSIAFWDNRLCQHFAASDYFPARRVMERVTIAGDRPYYRPPEG